jgi:hypothetical protein
MNNYSIDDIFSLAFAVSIATASTLISGVAHASTEGQVAVFIKQASSSESRAEVEADLAIWIAAGRQMYGLDVDVEVFSAAYKHDFATYADLRSSPHSEVPVTGLSAL